MAKYNTKVLGFGDNVVDLYEHSHMMYPGGNCVNLCAYSKMFGVERAAYMGYFGFFYVVCFNRRIQFYNGSSR